MNHDRNIKIEDRWSHRQETNQSMSFTIEFVASFLGIGMTAFEVRVLQPLTEDQVQSMVEILRTDLLDPINCNPENFDPLSIMETLETLFGSRATVRRAKILIDDMIHFIGSDTQELVIRVNGEDLPFDAIRDRFIETGLQEKPVTSHIHFCQNGNCGESKTKKCAGCYSTWYCSTQCQQADWPNHKTVCKEIQQDYFAAKLFSQIAERLGKDVATYPYEEFKQFLKSQPAAKDRTTMADWMEDWLEGWYTCESERKQLLRSVFLAKGLVWSSDVYPFYCEWSENRSGNRYEKIMAFVKETGFMF
jgi:hypothetical protein